MASSSDTAIPAGRGFAGASASHGVAFAAGNPDADRHHVDDEEAGAEETESDSEVEQEITLIEEGGNLPPEHDHAHPHEKRVTPGLLDRLPIHEFEDQVLERIALQKVTIVCGETGCGKSTAVPHFLIRDSVARGLHRPRIVVAQPRRVAAIRLAERVDAQLKELSKSNAVFRNPESGKRYRAGYRIMSDSSSDRGSSAAVLFATTGYLVSWIAADPTALDDATHIVLDEAHERSVDMDLLLLLVRRRLERERMTGVDSGLKVVIMSATLDVGLHGLYFERFFSRRPGIPDPLAPIDVTQRRYPVERIFLESLLTHPLTSEAFAAIDRDLQNAYVETYATPMEPWAAPGELQRTLSKFAVAVSGTTGSNYLAPHIDDEGLKLGVALAFHFGEIPFQKVLPGSIPFEEILGEPKKSTSILVFLPGENEILAFLESLEEAMTYYVDPTEWERIRTHVLHSSTAKEEQDKAFLPVDRSKGQVKIVLATNIAESSVTMPDAEYVIDFGLRRAMEFNAQRGMQQLSLGWISRASYKQRSGRVGRCSPGVYVGLYTQPFLEKVCREHEPPEISQITLEGVVLRVKDTFPGERAVDLLNELVEPPGSEQLDAAFTKLKENGALLSLPSDARKAIREATEVPGATFAEPRHKKSKVVGGGVVSVDPEQADRVDAEEGIVTFLGRAYPAVGAELTQVKMLLIASASGCAVEGAVLAAALSAQDVFSLPFPTHSKDREKLQKFLGASFAGRLTADGGSHSEPIGLLEVFARWLDTPTDGQQRRSLLFSYSLHQQRFRHFRALCSTFALRLAHLLEKFVLLEDTKGKRPGPQHASQSGLGQSGARATTPEDILATRSTVARLRALAAVAYETDFRLSDRRKLYQDLGLPFTEDQKEFPIASHLFFAPRDHLRSLLLVCCAPNVFQARPADTATDALRSAVGKLDRHRKWALGLSQYGGPGGVSNNVAEKAFSSEVVGFSADGWASDETDKDVSNGSLGLLRNFAYGTAAENLGVRPVGADPVVPGLVTKKQNQAAQTPAPSGMSFAASPKMMSSLRARYRDLDPRHTVVITLNDKCPMGLRSADAIRSTFAWIGAERVTAVEVAKGKKILQAYVVEFDPSGSWGSHLQADAEDPDSIFHVWNQTGYGARLAYYLCMGRPWALALPIPGGGGLDSRRPALVGSSNTAGSHSAMNMGADVGSIAVPGALAFSSANPIHAKMQLRTYWRSPSVSGLGFVLLTDDPGASDLAKAPENGAELVKQLQRPIQILHRKRGLGRPAYAIAGSIMIVGETTSFRGQTNPSTLNLTTVTLIPADEPAWNLRLLAISNDPESCYLRLEDPLHASALRHPFWDYAQSELKPNLKNFAKTMRVAQMEHDAQLVKESFGGKGRKMRREELDVVNQVRTALRNVMIRGVGLSTATSELGRSLFDGIDEAGRAIKARGQEGEVPLITLPKTLGKPTQEGPYWAKFAAEPDAVGQKANSDATGLEAKVGSMSIGAGLPTEFAFFFDSVSTAGDVSRGILPDAAMLAIEQSFLPPFAWPKWDPPQAPPPSAFGFGYGMPSGFARGGNVSSYVEDSEDEMFDDEDSEDSSDYY